MTLEAIAGIVEDDDPIICARREAHEEAGLRLRVLEPVANVWSMPGLSTERITLYLAPYQESDYVGQPHPVSREDAGILVTELRLSELAAMAERGALDDLKTLALTQALRLKRPELFV
jgi:8-oxo-dGTP pyrophosphatase MutT (NUDIX family)